jgi:hypothetical protein
MQRPLKPYEGRIIETYTGVENKLLRVTQDSVFVGTTKSPTGEPVPIDDIQDAIQRLIDEHTVLCQGAAPRSNRDSFVVAFLLSLPGVEKHPNRAGAVLADQPALEQFFNAEGV